MSERALRVGNARPWNKGRMRRTAGILTAALVAVAFAAPAAVQAQSTSVTTTVTTTTPLPFHNEGPVQYNASTGMFVIHGAAMSKTQAAAWFEARDPFYWPTLEAEFNATPAEFADHWNQLAFNLPPLVRPSDMTGLSPDAPI